MYNVFNNHGERVVPMTYVIAEPCIDVKDRACVDVRPVDCIPRGRADCW
jgi:hypothetical protein